MIDLYSFLLISYLWLKRMVGLSLEGSHNRYSTQRIIIEAKYSIWKLVLSYF